MSSTTPSRPAQASARTAAPWTAGLLIVLLGALVAAVGAVAFAINGEYLLTLAFGLSAAAGLVVVYLTRKGAA